MYTYDIFQRRNREDTHRKSKGQRRRAERAARQRSSLELAPHSLAADDPTAPAMGDVEPVHSPLAA